MREGQFDNWPSRKFVPEFSLKSVIARTQKKT